MDFGSDIPAGAIWSTEIMNNLSSADVGIIFLTPENKAEPWLLFEAGALANRFGTGSRVCLYLLGMRKPIFSTGRFPYISSLHATGRIH